VDPDLRATRQAQERAERRKWFTREVKKLTKQVESIKALNERHRNNLETLLRAPVVSIDETRSVLIAIDQNAKNLVSAKEELARTLHQQEDEVVQSKLDLSQARC
jgi:hypothetical protein